MDKYQPNTIEPKWPRTTLTSSRGLRPRVGGASIRGEQKYNHLEIESRLQKKWEEWSLYQAKDLEKKPKKYLLIEFPYPSGERLHVGHGRSYCCLDAMARLSRMKGFNVLYPIGWDAFGLPAENYAIKTGINPAITTKENIKNAKAQAKSWGLSFDWSREVNTTDTNYYKWTQWIFIQLFKKGLAYQAEVTVNWCPKCKTNLADEEVLSDGAHERCGEKTERRMQKQWLIKITAYAERLLKDLDLVNYREDIKVQQINWIGKSSGAEIEFKVICHPEVALATEGSHWKQGDSSPAGRRDQNDINIKVFTTRLDTIFGATFLVLAPENPVLEKINKIIPQERIKEVNDYIKKSLNKSELERISEVKEKSGVFTGLYAINPLNNEKIPIFIADYVVMTYGTGAIMGVPAHDRRDYEFAKKYGLKIVEVVKPNMSLRATVRSEAIQKENLKAQRDCFVVVPPPRNDKLFSDYGILVNSGEYSGLTSQEAIKRLLKYIKDNHIGSEKVQYHLRDWVFSRQHYWGEPIPMIFCARCAEKEISYFDVIPSDPARGGGIEESRSPQATANARSLDFAPHQTVQGFARDDSKKMFGWFPVPENELPVELPYLEKYQPSGTGESPLSKMTDWVNTKCPNCGGPAKRETDTMPNWAGSNWYYLGYVIAHSFGMQNAKVKMQNDNSKFKNIKNENIFLKNEDLLKYWLPIDLYNGGMEHTTLHLLYSRFIYKFLYDLGCVPTPEPYARRWSHGVVLGPDGAKMSKSKGNVVNPDEIVKNYGADTFRLYEGFMGPFEQMIAWNEKGVKGCYRFLKRVWKLVADVIPSESAFGGRIEESRSPQATANARSLDFAPHQTVQGFARDDAPNHLWRVIYKTTKKVEEDIWHLKFNTAIASLMELLNAFYASKDEVTLEMLKHYLLLLAPFAPFISEELWDRIMNHELRVKKGNTYCSSDSPEARSRELQSIHQQPWPKYDESLLKDEEVTIVIQVNGKLRDTIEVRSQETGDREEIEELAKNREKIAKYLQGKKIKKVIYVPGRLINFVT